MSDLEKVYDDQIAPLLKQAGEIAQEHDLPFLALVEAGDVLGKTTAALPARDEMSATLLLVLMAEQARGNLDGLLLAVLRDSRHHGHRSALLRLLESKLDDLRPQDLEVRHE